MGKEKAERKGEHCSWKCAAAADRGKEQSLEKGKQKGRQQKSDGAEEAERFSSTLELWC